MRKRIFTAYFTLHGPIVAAQHGRWIAEALMNRPIPALEQSWLRTKATDLASYLRVARLKANSSNDTIFADDKGEIAFLVPQFIPKRNNRFDYTRPVDGSNPATAWQGLTPLKDMPNVLNPPTDGCSTPTTGRGRSPADTVRKHPIIRNTWTPSDLTRAASTRG